MGYLLAVKVNIIKVARNPLPSIHEFHPEDQALCLVNPRAVPGLSRNAINPPPVPVFIGTTSLAPRASMVSTSPDLVESGQSSFTAKETLFKR